jgi:hypothetical protein
MTGDNAAGYRHEAAHPVSGHTARQDAAAARRDIEVAR